MISESYIADPSGTRVATCSVMPRPDTLPLFHEEVTESIALDTTQLQVRSLGAKRLPVVMPWIDPRPAPPRPRWADGVVPRRRR